MFDFYFRGFGMDIFSIRKQSLMVDNIPQPSILKNTITTLYNGNS